MKGRWGKTPLTFLSVLYPLTSLPRRWATTHFGGNQLSPGLLRSFAPSPRLGERTARQHPFGPPSGFRLTSPCPGLDHPASSLTRVTPGPYRTQRLTGQRPAARLRFPYASGLYTLKLATRVNSPARVSRRSVRPWSPPLVLPRRRGLLRGGSSPFGPHTSVTAWFQALFTPLPGFFSAFRHRTSALSVLGCI